jgi:citrate synthase
MAEWMDRQTALATLGVRPQTLYAYVSRGRIGMMPDPADPRRSLYRADDIAELTTRRARGRTTNRIAASTIAWGEPVIATGISTVRHGRLIYRGKDAVTLAATATLEETAALLWQSAEPVTFPTVAVDVTDPFCALAALVATSHPTLGRSAGRLYRDAAVAIGHLAASFGIDGKPEPLHQRVGRRWHLSTAHAERVRQALVLVADHELNASTFVTRVAASTGASVAASLLAGLGAAPAVAAWLARGRQLPGFGHPLYPQGDVRAAALLGGLAVDQLTEELREAARAATGALPNIDFALAALTRSCGLPPGAPLALFTLGRSVGWAAHAIEQITTGALIRPRARYREAEDQDPAES